MWDRRGIPVVLLLYCFGIAVGLQWDCCWIAWWGWHCCGIAGPVALLCQHCGIAVILLCDCRGIAVGVLWSWCGIAVSLLLNSCGIAVELLWYYCGINSVLLWDFCVIAVGLLGACCMMSLWYWCRFSVRFRLLWHCRTIVILLWDCYGIARQSWGSIVQVLRPFH